MSRPPEPGPDDVDFPVVVSLGGRRCLVVGGGPVAARKVQRLLDAGGVLTLVAPALSPTLEEVLAGADPEQARVEQRPYRQGEAGTYEFVVAATGDHAVDRQVTEDALAGSGLVNGTASSHVRAVHLPAVHRQGKVAVAVSTAGRSPALARWVRDRIAREPGPDLGVLCDLVGAARDARRHGGGVPSAGVDWTSAIGEAAALLEAGRVEEARRTLEQAGYG